MNLKPIAAALSLTLPTTHAWSHTAGVHKRDVVTVNSKGLEILVTLDFDAGKRALLLRQGADRNADGRLSKEELTQLKSRLDQMARSHLHLTIAGYNLALTASDSKLSIRENFEVSDTGVSYAVLLKSDFPSAPTRGMVLEVADESPDRSHVRVEVFDEGAPDSWGAPQSGELRSGEKLTVRLGARVESKSD